MICKDQHSAIRAHALPSAFCQEPLRAADGFRASEIQTLRSVDIWIGWYDVACGDGTEICIIDQLLAEAKALAARQRTSLTRLIEEGLQLRLRAQSGSSKRRRVRLPVYKGSGGLVAGVNPLSNKAVLEALGDDA